MRVRNHGKYTKMRRNDPRGIGTCDFSGLMVQHARMKQQLAYRGRGLVKTGYLVNPKFWDQPNPQDLTPLIYIDPKPLTWPRPDVLIDNQTQPVISYIDVSGGNLTLTVDQFTNYSFSFFGALAADTTVFVPGVQNVFYAANNTTGAHKLYIQILDVSSSKIEVPQGETPLIFLDDFSNTG